MDPLIAAMSAYLESIPAAAMAGNVGAIVIGLILFYIGLWLVNKLSFYLVKVIKYVVIVAIVFSSFYALVMAFIEKMAGAETTYILLGLVGIGIGFGGALYALYSLYEQATRSGRLIKARQDKVLAYQQELIDADRASLEAERAKLSKEKESLNAKLSASDSIKAAIKKQSVLLTIVTYILIAQFGVFSSVTISAPNTETGMIMFGVFAVGVMIYMLKNYPEPVKALGYIGAAFAASFAFSIVLGHYWAGHAYEEMLTLGYFAMDTLVAMVSSVALSLFMAAKGN